MPESWIHTAALLSKPLIAYNLGDAFLTKRIISKKHFREFPQSILELHVLFDGTADSVLATNLTQSRQQ